jgi:hypothetical protein
VWELASSLYFKYQSLVQKLGKDDHTSCGQRTDTMDRSRLDNASDGLFDAVDQRIDQAVMMEGDRTLAGEREDVHPQHSAETASLNAHPLVTSRC